MINLDGSPINQLPLPLELPDPIWSRRTLGLLGELTCLREFQRAGYRAEHSRRLEADIRLVNPRTGEKILVEVKTARRDKRGNYQFCLYRELPRGVVTDYRHADYVVLLALLDGLTAVSFVIPVSAIDAKQISFKNPLQTRRWAAYRRDLTILEDARG